MHLRDGAGWVATLLITAAGYIVGGPYLAAILILLAVGVGLVAWTRLGDWLGFRRKTDDAQPPVVRHTLDGHASLRIGLRPDRPQVVLWESGIENPNAFNLDGVAINALVTEGVRVGYCNADGEVSDRGGWLTTPERFEHEPEPGSHKEYWACGDLTLPGEGHRLVRIKLRIDKPGTYYLCTELFGSVRKQRKYTDLVVTEAEQVGVRGILGELISTGESIARGPAAALEDNAEEHGAWVIDTAMAQETMPEPHRAWLRQQLDRTSVGGSGTAWRIAHAKAVLPHLYEARRRVAGGV